MHIQDAEDSGIDVFDARCGEHVLRRLLLGEKSPARVRSQLSSTSRKTLQSLALAEVTTLGYCNCPHVSTHALASTEKEEIEYGTSE